jgi:hypothetical protein
MGAMPIALLDRTRVFVDLRATGLLRGLAHDPTLTASPELVSVEAGEGDSGSATTAVFRVESIEPPGDMSAADRGKMLENLRGSEVLDAVRFPTITLRGRYRAATGGGMLSGTLTVRGVARPVSMTVRVVREGDGLVASGAWEGKLTDLGIKPFKALLGALKLQDWIRLRFEAKFTGEGVDSRDERR